MYWLDKYQNIYIYMYKLVYILFYSVSDFKKKMVAVIQPINKHFIN